MIEEFVIGYAPQRAKERGFEKYRLDYRDINLGPQETLEIPAYNEIWFIISLGDGVSVSSDYGQCDFSNPLLSENIHEHGDWIIIKNKVKAIRQVKFIIAILDK